MSKSPRLLRTNERLWAICSGHPEGMSDCEQIGQVTHQKWANEQIVHFLCEWLIRSLFWQKTVNSSEIWWAHSQPCLQCDYVFEFAKRFYFSSFLYTVVGINLENYLLLLVLLRKNKDHFNKEKDFVLNIPPLIPIKFLYIVCTL